MKPSTLGWILCLVLTAQTGQAVSFEANVINVMDGDSIAVATGAAVTVEVELAAIDAPELGQQSGEEARDALAGKILGKVVRLNMVTNDLLTAPTAYVFEGRHRINEEMLAEGWAWHVRRLESDPKFDQAERRARSRKLGLWSKPNPFAPWDFRFLKAAPHAIATNGLPAPESTIRMYWFDPATGLRHTIGCPAFMNTAKGRLADPEEGRPCPECPPPTSVTPSHGKEKNTP
jgi:endonuclease YncB( thermonuclease family)